MLGSSSKTFMAYGLKDPEDGNGNGNEPSTSSDDT